jgi:transposase
MTDDEWAIFEPFLTTPSPQGGRPPSNHRRVLDGILWIARTGAPWRDLPAEFGNWNSVWRQFRRWCLTGVWDILLQALVDSGGDVDALQMIDSTTVRAHRCAAGEKGGVKIRHLAARGVDLRAKSMSAATRSACPLGGVERGRGAPCHGL